MESNNISMRSIIANIPIFQSAQTETFQKISPECEAKIKKCFIKLDRVIRKNNKTLWQVFHDFDVEKTNNLNAKEFKKIL